jgi:hypothetical protein
MYKHLDRLILGSVLLGSIGFIFACLWFLLEIRILHWFVLFLGSSWLIGMIVRKLGGRDD